MALATWIALTTGALALELAPFKDRLFAYPGILKPDDNENYIIVDYREARDINLRDQVPERRVWPRYISLQVRKQQNEVQVDTPIGPLGHFVVGRTNGATVITIYLHGKGGSRKQGVNDYTFGGNFNRLKNLMMRNGGLYISPDVPGFNAQGTEAIAALIAHYRQRSPGARLIVACGSLGGEVCYRLAARKQTASVISGYVLLGSAPTNSVFSSSAYKRSTPFVFAHGSRDTVYPVEAVEAHFRRFETSRSDYPARFIRFETGTHGTPIRMVDWRDVLNWILSRS